jgi:hypothetical protein
MTYLNHSTHLGNTPRRRPQFSAPSQPIRAELHGSDTCTAEGFTARGHAPVLALCRLLVDAGIDPGRPLHAYRSTTLSLAIRSIGEGAKLTVKDRPFGPVFEKWVPFSTPPVGPPMRSPKKAAQSIAAGGPTP